jgi:hypothetical protein
MGQATSLSLQMGIWDKALVSRLFIMSRLSLIEAQVLGCSALNSVGTTMPSVFTNRTDGSVTSNRMITCVGFTVFVSLISSGIFSHFVDKSRLRYIPQ